MNESTAARADKITDTDFELARAYRRRLFADLEGLIQSTECFLDKPEDRLYHAEDRTWWRREGLSLKTADPPPEIQALKAALAQVISRGCTCDHLYGATCNIHKLGTAAGIEEAVDHLKTLEEAVLLTNEFFLKLDGIEASAPVRSIRQHFHGALREKLDAALKGVPNA